MKSVKEKDEKKGRAKEKIEEQKQDLEDQVLKQVRGGIRFLFRDMEIERSQLRFLILIALSTVALAGTNFYYSGDLIDRDKLFGGSALGTGLFIGLFISAFILDRLYFKYPLLIFIFITSPLLNLIGIVLHELNFMVASTIIFSLNTVLSIMAMLIVLFYTIHYTSRIERGRIMAIITFLVSISLFILFFFITRGILGIIPGIFPIFVALYIYKNRYSEKSITHFVILDKAKELRERRAEIAQQGNLEEELPKERKEEDLFKKVKNIHEKIKKEGLHKSFFKILEIADDTLKQVRNNFREKRSLKEFLKFFFSNKLLLRYILIIFTGGILVGLLVPLSQFIDTLLTSRTEATKLSLFIFVPLFIIVGAFLIGLLYDFYGRKRTITTIILLVGIINFFNVFRAEELSDHVGSGLFIGITYALFLAIPLVTGDMSHKEFLVRILVIFVTTFTLGIGLGVFLKQQYIFELIQKYPILQSQFGDFLDNKEGVIYFNYSISSLIFLICLIMMFLMSTIENDKTLDEQNWPEKLIHLYVVHNSGLLLYEHAFKEEEGLAEADLISGGLIGLVTILKEITHGKQKLRVIDHGDKKLIFQWDSKERIVFVMVIERDLLIIRQKLAQFARAFELKFDDALDNFMGVEESFWRKPAEKLVKFIFTRKYMNWLMEDILTDIPERTHNEKEGERKTETQ